MNKRTHMMLGRMLLKRLASDFGVYLERESFLLGNILPDLQLSFIVRPHIIDSSLRMLRDEIKNLIETKQDSAYYGKYYSRRLGVICHYCADFFCFPHSRYYKGDLPAHVRYEKSMFEALRENAAAPVRTSLSVYHTDEISDNDVINCLNKSQDAYHKAVPSFETDLYYSLQACLDIVLMITKASLADVMPETDGLTPPLLFT